MPKIPETLRSYQRSVSRLTLARILADRPYHPWCLIPLTATLIERDYPSWTRVVVVDTIEHGGTIAGTIAAEWLEPEHRAAAEAAIAAGLDGSWLWDGPNDAVPVAVTPEADIPTDIDTTWEATVADVVPPPDRTLADCLDFDAWVHQIGEDGQWMLAEGIVVG
jgi:hypothetical protein